MAVTFPRASVFEGLPTELFDTLGDYMDSRLKESSMRTVNAAMVHWRKVALRYGWQVLMLSDDPHRGGKMAAFVLEMAKDTDLAYGSISKKQDIIWSLMVCPKLVLTKHTNTAELGVNRAAQIIPLSSCPSSANYCKARLRALH
jgi:hypothetical protein